MFSVTIESYPKGTIIYDYNNTSNDKIYLIFKGEVKRKYQTKSIDKKNPSRKSMPDNMGKMNEFIF